MLKDGLRHMGYINRKPLISCLLLAVSALTATEYAPWFTPPFEFQGEAAYLNEQANRVQSPQGSFHSPLNYQSLHFGLAVTPWPYWNIETELYLTDTSSFSYEASLLTIRYSLLDDICGDPFSLVTGVTASLPGHSFLHNYAFAYHGHVNGEFHVTVGKELASCRDWLMRFWLLTGLGIASQGSPWLHAIGVGEYKPSPSLKCKLYSEALYGLGSDNIIPNIPFEGYGPIQHQTIDLGARLDYQILYTGTFYLISWYNLYSKNFATQYWGLGAGIRIPFGIIR